MKKTVLFMSLLSVLATARAQNVGIGTTSPAARLHVDAAIDNMAIFNSNSTSSYILFTENNYNRGYIGSAIGAPEDFDIGTTGSAGARLHFTTTGLPRLTIAGNGNVGIGTTSPGFLLDMAGRLRIQHSSNTAGIWFDGSSGPLRAFAGMADDQHVGFFGNAGAGWNFTMNAINGNTGIGTAAPTAKLDINGAVRIRGGSPAPGSVLTSVDANGNAVWKENNVAFKVYGMNSGYNYFPSGPDYRRVHFGGEKFDLGSDYTLLPPGATADANSSTFTIPVSGVYHFDVHAEVEASDFTEAITGAWMIIRLNRNGVISDLAESMGKKVIVGDFPGDAGFSINTAALLQAGDKVYIELHVYSYSPYCTIKYGEKTWFSGFLVKAL